MSERLKLHFETSSAMIASTVEEVKDAMNDEQRCHLFPNPNDRPICINTERINWVEYVDR